MPIAGLHIPPVPRKRHLAGARIKVEDLELRIVRRRQELCVGGTPREISHCIVMRVVHGLDVVEVRPPVLHVALLAAGYQPVVAVRPFRGGDAGLVLIVVSLQ